MREGMNKDIGGIDREKVKENMGNRRGGDMRDGVRTQRMSEPLKYWFSTQLVTK